MNLEKIKQIFNNICNAIKDSNIDSNAKTFILYTLYGTFVLAPILMIIGLITLLITHPFILIALIIAPFVYIVYKEFKKKQLNDIIDVKFTEKKESSNE